MTHENKISKISELKRALSIALKATPDNELPLTYIFDEGMEFSKYKITLELIEQDSFIDKKGRKWVRSDI